MISLFAIIPLAPNLMAASLVVSLHVPVMMISGVDEHFPRISPISVKSMVSGKFKSSNTKSYLLLSR